MNLYDNYHNNDADGVLLDSILGRKFCKECDSLIDPLSGCFCSEYENDDVWDDDEESW